MSALTSPVFVIALFACIRSIHLCVTAIRGRETGWAIAYGVGALLALLALLVLLGVRL